MFFVDCREKCNEVTDQHLNPVKVLHAAEEVMSEDAIMVADGGDFVGTAAYILRYHLSFILRWNLLLLD